MNRGLSRREIFLSDDDYELFMEALKETQKLFFFRIICYCLMPNHYHLLIQTPRANLSGAMRHLNGVYTQRFNRLHKKDGPLFRGRYKAVLIQEDEYLTHLIRYIHLNPVQACLAKSPEGCAWTSYKQYLKAKDDKPWLFIRLGLSFFAANTSQALKAYREFMGQGIDPKTQAFYDRKHLEPVFGDSNFIKRIKEKYIYGKEKLDSEIPEERRATGEIAAQRIIREVCRSFSESEDRLYSSKRGEPNHARLCALALTRQLSGLKLSEIAKLFRIRTYRTVGTSCYRFKKLMNKDAKVRQRYAKICLACSQEKT
jgi:REP element-mobilizing transposase RayT